MCRIFFGAFLLFFNIFSNINFFLLAIKNFLIKNFIKIYKILLSFVTDFVNFCNKFRGFTKVFNKLCRYIYQKGQL